jgi:hypothetical protein
MPRSLGDHLKVVQKGAAKIAGPKMRMALNV